MGPSSVRAFACEKTEFFQNRLRRKAEHGADARILQRRHAYSATAQDGREPASGVRAETAFGVEEKPAAGTSLFSVGELIGKGNHVFSLWRLRQNAPGAHPARLPSRVTTLPRS